MTFRFRPVATIFTLIGIAILISLGTWQLQRLEWKRDLIATVEARLGAEPIAFDTALSRWREGEEMTYTPVTLQGSFVHDGERPVFGAIDGEPGWFIFTPLQLAGTGGEIVYVNRGFVPERLKDPATRADTQPTGPVTVTGLFRAPESLSGIASLVSAPNDPQANSWHIRDPREFQTAEATGTLITPAYIDSFASGTEDAYPLGGTTRLDFPNRHLEYAFTWFGLALTLLAVYLAFSIKRRDEHV